MSGVRSLDMRKSGGHESGHSMSKAATYYSAYYDRANVS